MLVKEKLVRDLLDRRIPPAELRTETDQGVLAGLLAAKLAEETSELSSSGYRDAAEYADVLEVLFAIARMHGLSEADIGRVREEKRAARGGFDRGLVWTGPGAGR